MRPEAMHRAVRFASKTRVIGLGSGSVGYAADFPSRASGSAGLGSSDALRPVDLLRLITVSKY